MLIAVRGLHSSGRISEIPVIYVNKTNVRVKQEVI